MSLSGEPSMSVEHAAPRPQGSVAPAAIRLSHVCKSYDTQDAGLLALQDISLDIEAGQFVAVVGPSGCGKSTLLRVVAGLIGASEGEIWIGDTRVRGTRRDVGIVFQSPVLFPWRTVLENVLIPIDVQGLGRTSHIGKARELLDLVGLRDFADRYPAELSGGMQQRVGIARALIHDPAMLLMDEPFGALDAMTREQMNIELLRIWGQSRKTVIFITHSIAEAIFLSDRVIAMTARPGTIAEVLTIDLPRPRDLSVINTERFGRYAAKLRSRLDAQGGMF